MTRYKRYRVGLTIRADVRAFSRFTALICAAIHVYESGIRLLLGIAQPGGQANVAILFIGSAAGTCISVWVARCEGRIQLLAVKSVALLCGVCRRSQKPSGNSSKRRDRDHGVD